VSNRPPQAVQICFPTVGGNFVGAKNLALRSCPICPLSLAIVSGTCTPPFIWGKTPANSSRLSTPYEVMAKSDLRGCDGLRRYWRTIRASFCVYVTVSRRKAFTSRGTLAPPAESRHAKPGSHPTAGAILIRGERPRGGDRTRPARQQREKGEGVTQP